MSHPLDDDAREQAARAERLRAKVLEDRTRKDVQAVMATEQGRRVVFGFLQTAGVDTTPFRADPAAMGHAVGWQDAGRYWLALIRSHCPEREAQMRAEAKRDIPQDEETNDE
jgi:hypothetical protein